MLSMFINHPKTSLGAFLLMVGAGVIYAIKHQPYVFDKTDQAGDAS